MLLTHMKMEHNAAVEEQAGVDDLSRATWDPV